VKPYSAHLSLSRVSLRVCVYDSRDGYAQMQVIDKTGRSLRCPLSHGLIPSCDVVAMGVVVRPCGDGGVVKGIDQDLLIGVQHRREAGLSLDVTVSMALEHALTLAGFCANSGEQEK